MATTTTNYGFDVPTSSDLVKNGATQIALLGQDLDTFLFRPFTRNGVLNSGMNVWQRGTSGTANGTAAGTGYNADRWWNYYAGTITVSRQATGDTTNLPNIQYCARVQRNSGQTSATSIYHGQDFETLNSVPYAGKIVSFSFYARKGANYSGASSNLTAVLQSGTGTDQHVLGGYTGSTNPISSSATLTTTWQRFTFTGTVPTNSTQLAVYFTYDGVGTAGANDYFEVTGVQLEVGNQASPYAPATPTYATELAACQRYCQMYLPTAGNTDYLVFGGTVDSSAYARYPFVFPVVMRLAPTLTTSGTANNYANLNASGRQLATAVPTLETSRTFSASVTCTSGGLSTGQATSFRNGDGTGGYLLFTAEL
jgi:hypothetical protein